MTPASESTALDLDSFRGLIAGVTADIAGRPIDVSLEPLLQQRWGPRTDGYAAIRAHCLAGVAGGWMCQREAGGIRYGRVVKHGPETHGFSVDVVDMERVAGPYHRHPDGEIDLVMPLDASARFDGRGAGWLVYGPDSAHPPTVSDGRALVLYLLPGGAIDFSAQPV